MILSIDQVNDILDEMAEGFPAVLFEELNGGELYTIARVCSLRGEPAGGGHAGPGVSGGGDVFPGGVLRRLSGALH